MKSKSYFLCLLLWAVSCMSFRLQLSDLREGDIIFHTSTSSQSKAIQAATHSRYSHTGIIFKKNNQWQVLEAVQPVKYTPLDKWIARGERGHYVIKRLKKSEQLLTQATINKMKSLGEAMLGKNYDLYFEWSDQRIYCSELVWKIYKQAPGVEIGKLQHLREFGLSAPAVRQKMQERYGNKIPLDELVISPAALFESTELVTVLSH